MVVEFWGRPAGDCRGRPGEVQHEDLLSALPADRGEVALDQVKRAAVAELLVIHPRVVGRGALRSAGIAELVVPRDVEADEAVVPAGHRTQADQVLVRA